MDMQKEMWNWFIFRVVVPLALPFVWFALWGFLYDIKLFAELKLLLDNGFLTFFALVVLISLFQDYGSPPTAFTISLCFSITVCSIFSFVFFGISVGILEKAKNDSLPLIMTLIFISVALIFKHMILKMKYLKINTINNK